MKNFSALLALLAVPAFATVNVSSPTSGTSVGSSVHFVASATTSCSGGVSSMGIYPAPSVLAYTVSGSSLNTYLTLSPGTYNAVVQEWDTCGSTKQRLPSVSQARRPAPEAFTVLVTSLWWSKKITAIRK